LASGEQDNSSQFNLRASPLCFGAGICWDSRGSRFAWQRAWCEGSFPSQRLLWQPGQLCSHPTRLGNTFRGGLKNIVKMLSHICHRQKPLQAMGGCKRRFSAASAGGWLCSVALEQNHHPASLPYTEHLQTLQLCLLKPE